jgi:hypothetical protein
MPFLIRPSRRFPVCCFVTYHAGPFEGHGMVWNLSVNGWQRGRLTDEEAGPMSWLRRGLGTCSRSIKHEGEETSET